MRRWIIDSITKFVCWIRRKQKIKPKGEVAKVNLGSGLWVAHGWTNVDASPDLFLCWKEANIFDMKGVKCRWYIVAEEA